MHMQSVSVSNDGLYLDLMKKALLASIYDENAWYVLGSLDPSKPKSLKQRIKLQLVRFAWAKGFLIVKPGRNFDANNANWGLFSYTMVGLPRLNDIQDCIEDVLRNNV